MVGERIMRNATDALVAGLTAAWLASGARAEVRVSRTASELRVGNGILSLAVSSDGRSLRSFRYGAQELVELPGPLYEILLAEKDGGTFSITSTDPGNAEIAVRREGESAVLEASATAHGEAGVGVAIRVCVDASPFTKWRAVVTNRGDFGVRSITYPIVAAPRALGCPHRSLSSGNLVGNAGFEDGLQGWDRLSVRRDEGRLDVAADAQVARSGRASARLTFGFEENAQTYCPVQTVPVAPDTAYLLSAHFKTELESGTIHMEVQDARGWKKLCKQSARVAGKANWRRVAVAFRTTPETTAIRLGPRHVGSAGDGRPMAGTVWLDDVRLVRDVDRRPFMADDGLVYPHHDGVLVPAPGEKLDTPHRAIRARYPGASMQLMAYFDR